MSRRPAEDLFENTRMSFGQHLEELRGALVRSLFGIVIGCIFGFMLADDVVNFLQTPLLNAIQKFHDQYALQEYRNRLGYFPPEFSEHVRSDNMSPDVVYVDPGQLVQAIRAISPESLSEIQLIPYQFPAEDILPESARAIAAQLVSPPANDSRVAAIASLLNSEERETLSRVAGTASGSVSDDDRNAVVAVLNRVIDDPALHQSQAFGEMLAEPEGSWTDWISAPPENPLRLMKVQADANPADVELSRRLNRQLVVATFPDLIPAPGIDLVPLDIWQPFAAGTQALSPHEVFMVWMKAAIITGLVISAPWVFYQIWVFVAAGLYPHEQKYVFLYLPISLALFFFGVCLAFFFVFDPVLNFLFSFNAEMGIRPELRIGEWLTFVIFLPLGFGIAFQLPLVMLFLERIGLVTVQTYTRHWRVSVMVIAVVSMVLTPAEPISMIMMGVPLTGLYFLGIGLCHWMPRPRSPFREAAA
jgi:sec-independent protein translocase protein TatC